MILVAIIGKRYDRYTASRCEDSAHLYIAGVHQFHEIFHDDIDAILMEVAVVAEAEEIELETLALHHIFVGDIIYYYMSEIRLACLGAKRCKFGTVEGDKIVVLGMFIFKRLEHLGGIVSRIYRAVRPQKST